MREMQLLRIPFDGLMATHRGARRRLQLAVVALLAVGTVLLALGLAGWLPQLPALVIGVVTVAVAIIPFSDMIERGERIERLAALRAEWRALAQSSSNPRQDTDRFIELLWKLYDKR